MTDKKVSVIVPVYKVEKYLEQCIDSIIGQTYQNLEIILVDDGSPDNCGRICDEYAATDDRIKVIHQENGGLSAARNAGLDIATGDYIAFVDSDDWILPNAIERMHRAYATSCADLVVCNFGLFYEQLFLGERRAESNIEDEVLTQEQLMNKCCKHSDWYIVPWNKLYKKSIFDVLRFLVGYRHEDEAIFHYVIEKCKTIATVSDRLYIYRQSSGSIMGSGLSIESTDILYALGDRLRCARKHRWHEYEKALAAFYETKFWELYHLFSEDKGNEKYTKRMESSLKKALPSVLNSNQVSGSHKIYLTLLRFSPKLFWIVYRSIRRMKT